MATNIVTPQTLDTAQALCTAAQVGYTNITNAVLLRTFGAKGGVIYGCTAVPGGTITATKCVLLASKAGIIRPIAFGRIAAYTELATDMPPTVDMGFSEMRPRRVGPAESIYAATLVANVAGIAFDLQFEELV